jgi:hypothetical protein
VLDPRHKTQLLKKLFTDEGKAKQRIDKIIEYINNNYTQNAGDSTPHSSETEKGFNFEEFFNDIDGFGCELQKSDVEAYLEEKCVSNYEDFDVLRWWKDRAHQYPVMARVARDFLSIPCASVSVERMFNLGCDQIGLRRHNMSSDSLQQVMVIQHTQREKNKNTLHE